MRTFLFQRALLGALIVTGGVASPLRGQFPGEVRGRVLDRVRGGAVEAATVTVAAAGVSTTSDATGGFRLRGLEPGRHDLLVERLGYLPARRTVEVRNGAPTSLTVALDPAPVGLAPLLATAASTPPGGVRLEAESFPAGAGSAGDLLRAVPGVLVRSRGPGSPETVSIRGSSADAVLVLLDGVPLGDPLTGEADLSTVPASALASVTVLPGARSARYGPRAAGGVILLERKGEGAPGPTASLGVGSLGTRRVSFSGGRGLGSLRVGGSLGAERVGGRFSFDLPREVGGGRSTRSNADLAREHASLELAGGLAGGELQARVGLGRVARGLPGRSFLPSPEARQRESRADASLGWRGGPAPLRLDARAHVAGRRIRYLDPSPPTGLPYDESTRVSEAGWEANLLVLEPPTPLAGLRAGVDVLRQEVSASSLADEAPGARTDLHAYVSGDALLGAARREGASRSGPRLAVTVGLSRAGSGWAATHELALESPLGPLALHLSHRSAYSPPTLADQHFREGVGVRANPDLRGERVPGEIEGGVTLGGGGNGWEATAALSAYAGDVEGMIVWAPDHRFVWSPENVDVLRRGVETHAELRVALGEGDLSLAAHWTHARTTYDRGSGDDATQVAYRPRNLASLGALWSDTRWEVDAELRYTGLRYPFAATVNALPGFWTTDLGLARALPVGRWTLTPSLRVSRLFDNPDALLYGFPEPGRTLVLTLGAAPGPVP